MEKIAIYGAGGFGRETALMIEQINAAYGEKWQIIGFFDDGKEKGSFIDGHPVLGGINELNAAGEPVSLVLSMADSQTRRRLRESIDNRNVRFPPLIHPAALAGSAEFNRIGEGVIIGAGSILTTGVNLESFVIVNLACTIGHDVAIGSFATLMPACSISGSVRIAGEVLIGSGACILPGLSVGHRAKVGAGAVVLADVPADETVVGVPARSIGKQGGTGS